MRIIVLGCIFLCSLGLCAQNKTTATDSTISVGKDPLYLQIYLGANKSANENLPWTEFTRYPWSTGMFVGLGREVTRLWGWRLAFRINRNKSRNVPVCETSEVWGWSSTSLFADATFDITDAFRRSRRVISHSTADTDDFDVESYTDMRKPDTTSQIRLKPRKFNLKAFVGVGVAYTWGFDQVPLSYTHAYSRASRLVPAFRAGLTATYRLSDRWRLGLELSQNMFGDRFIGVAYDTPLDTRTNIKVGLTYLFKKRKKPAPKPVIRKVRLKDCPPLPLLMPDQEDDKLRQISGHAFLDFPVNETVIYPEYRKNPDELARIHASIDSALFDKAVVITRITLHGYASPESSYNNNTRLAKGRTDALKNYLIRHYNFDTSVFKTNYTPEDWENLKGFLTDTGVRRVKGNFWYDNKTFVETPEVPDYVLQNRTELLRIIGRNIDPDLKNELLKKVADGEPYRWLLEYVYPGLRHTDYVIEYRIRPFSVEKGRKLIYTHPEGLSLEEMYNVAMSYDVGSDNWLDALLIAVNLYPNNETANLNAACACVMTKRLTDAKKYLQKAGNSTAAKYVGDVVQAMEGTVKWKTERGRIVIINDDEQRSETTDVPWN